MKQVERYLCAQCWQEVESAKLKNEELEDAPKRERRPCAWCGRLCFGHTYQIFYGERIGK